MTRRGLTLVTALVDIGRAALAGGFSRGYEGYLEALPAVLGVERPLVVFADPAAEAVVWQHRSASQTIVRRLTASGLEDFPHWSAVQAIRSHPAWRDQAAWLADSPQACLPAYNPLVMSKLPWLEQTAEENPFGTTHFAWVDAGLARTVPAQLLRSALASDAMIDRLTRFLFLCYPYEGADEIHGFEREALARRAGTSYVRWVARGGFFGGSAAYVRRARAIYDALLEDTLADGLMGTEESVFTIMAHLHPALFDRHPIGDDGLVWPFFADVERRQAHVGY